MWLDIFKILCFIGWHLWEYLYAEVVPGASGDHTPHHRRCQRCGIEQKQLKGTWVNDQT